MLLAYELTNAIHAAARRMRLTPRRADSALENLLACEVVLHPPAPEETLALARRLGVSGYDAAYVALAERLNADLWTAEHPLFAAARTRCPECVGSAITHSPTNGCADTARSAPPPP